MLKPQTKQCQLRCEMCHEKVQKIKHGKCWHCLAYVSLLLGSGNLEATKAFPGSEEKLEILSLRATAIELGQLSEEVGLHHPEDNKQPAPLPLSKLTIRDTTHDES